MPPSRMQNIIKITKLKEDSLLQIQTFVNIIESLYCFGVSLLLIFSEQLEWFSYYKMYCHYC